MALSQPGLYAVSDDSARPRTLHQRHQMSNGHSNGYPAQPRSFSGEQPISGFDPSAGLRTTHLNHSLIATPPALDGDIEIYELLPGRHSSSR